MKNPQQIIDPLPEGNRKRACILLNDIGAFIGSRDVWQALSDGEYAKAADCMSNHGNGARSAQVLADMIWEG